MIILNDSDIIPLEKVEELLIKFQLQKDKYGMLRKEKNKSYKESNNIMDLEKIE